MIQPPVVKRVERIRRRTMHKTSIAFSIVTLCEIAYCGRGEDIRRKVTKPELSLTNHQLQRRQQQFPLPLLIVYVSITALKRDSVAFVRAIEAYNLLLFTYIISLR